MQDVHTKTLHIAGTRADIHLQRNEYRAIYLSGAEPPTVALRHPELLAELGVQDGTLGEVYEAIQKSRCFVYVIVPPAQVDEWKALLGEENVICLSDLDYIEETLELVVNLADSKILSLEELEYPEPARSIVFPAVQPWADLMRKRRRQVFGEGIAPGYRRELENGKRIR